MMRIRNFQERIEACLLAARGSLETLLAFSPVRLGMASPPMKSGVYAFSEQGEIVYVGEASGSKGLRDRILYKHLSGDEGHGLQRAFEAEYPDRKARRDFLKKSLHIQWVEISDSLAASVVEKLAIEVLEPKYNKAVQLRT